MSASCSYCRHILEGVSVPHTTIDCQYRQSMYCGVCMAKGHAPSDCPNKKAWAIRRGQDASKVENLVLEVEDSEKGIYEVLGKYNLKPGARLKDIRLQYLLRNLANSLNPPRLLHFRKV